MEFEFDPAKDTANLAKHGLPLLAGVLVVEAPIAEEVDDRFDYGEERVLAFGMVDGRLLACVYTIRNDIVRIISVRRANKREQAKWLK